MDRIMEREMRSMFANRQRSRSSHGGGRMTMMGGESKGGRGGYGDDGDDDDDGAGAAGGDDFDWGRDSAFQVEEVACIAALDVSPVVAASQSAVPQAQSAALAAVPSMVVQVGAGLQRSSFDVSQMSPVADVQAPEAPQTQGAGLAVAPSPWAQAGPVKAHRQA